ncbi:MAG: acyltransferase family protein, partial [Elusimicrobiota bacterium]|nr:acyltransferase family protein [Elusimicrobiota bacterium]
PFFAYSSMLSLNFPPMPAALFIKSAFFGPFYQQSVYWFLMVLFFFFLIYAVFKNFCVKKVSIKFSPSLILILFALSFASYSASVFYIKPAADWINIGYILYFQPARIAGYFLVFIFGAAAFSNNWFFEGKFALTAPFLISILSVIFMFGRTFIFAPFLSPAANIILEAFFYNTASLSIMFFLTALFFKIKNSFRFSSALSEFSYGVYFLHQIILMPVIYILIPYSVPIFFKWLAAVAITFFASLAIAKFVLKKAPLLKEIF